MDPEEANLIRTLQELQLSIEKGDKKSVQHTIAGFHQNLVDNKRRLSELYERGVECTTQTDLILAACRNKQADILYYILRETDILVHLVDDRLDDAEVNTQRTEALKHALRLENFNLVETLYDFWCGNLHWRGHDIENIKMVGNVLRNARDAFPVYDEQVQTVIHCLITFNDFQIDIYTELAGFDNSHEPIQSVAMIVKVLIIYDKYSDIKRIRRKHPLQECEQIITERIADNSSIFYINLEYIYQEVYFRKMDFNVALLILENVYNIREQLKTSLNKTESFYKANPPKRDLYKDAANKYKAIESEIYHYIYCTSEDWRHYLPQNRELKIEEHIVIHEGKQEKIKTIHDLHREYNGPVLFLERESFKESLGKFKTILEDYVIHVEPATQKDESEEIKLLNDNYLETVSYMRDHYSLIKIVFYIEAIEKTTNVNVAMIERVLQVVGEMLKSTDESYHLSRSTQALLQAAISEKTIRHLQKIRKFLSHTSDGELKVRIHMADTQPQRFEEIKEELIMSKQILNPILDVLKSILDKSLLEKGLRLLEERIKAYPPEFKTFEREINDIYGAPYHRDVLESDRFYQDHWKPAGLTLQLLEEIPWVMQNKARINEKIESAKRRINENVVNVILSIPSIIPYYRQMLNLIIDNNYNVKKFNEAISNDCVGVQMPYCPDKNELSEIKRQINEMRKKNKKLKKHFVLLNNIKNYKQHWESVKNILQFFLTECELFATLKDMLTETTTATEANSILKELEVICEEEKSNLAFNSSMLNKKVFTGIEGLHTTLESSIKGAKPEDAREAREELMSCLIKRLKLLKQTLSYPPQTPISVLVRRFYPDVQFRLTIEMVVADIANVLSDCGVKDLMAKPSNLFRDIDLGNVLDHGNPFLEVIGDIFNSHDLAAEWLGKAMMFAEDAEAIEALYELFEGKTDHRTIMEGPIDDQQKQLYEQFINSPNWKSYALLARYPIPKNQRQNKQP